MEYKVENRFVANLDEIQFYARLPKGLKEGTPPDGILALGVWYEKASVVKDLLSGPSSGNRFFRFADEHRLAVVSWPTATVYDNSKSFTEDVKDLRRGDDDFGKSMQSWDRGMQVVCDRLRVPYRDILIVGTSRGAQWAHRLALRMPEKFLAVHAHINSSYEEPQKAAKSCLWLITTGSLEGGYEDSKIFYRKCQALGFPILYKAQSNMGHASSPEIDALGMKFLEYAWQLKLERDKIRDQEKNDPAAVKTIPKIGFPDSMLKPFFDAPYVGDLFNEEVYPAARSKEIPAAFRVPIPTKELAESWGFFNK